MKETLSDIIKLILKMDFKSKAKFFQENGKDMLTIDCGLTYYSAVVSSDNFSEDFKDNYKEIVFKSLNGYKDETFTIYSSFEHEDYSLNNRYNIIVSFKNTFYNFTKTFSIPLTVFHKEKVDYLEERVRELEHKNNVFLDRIIVLETLTSKLTDLLQDKDKQTNSNLDSKFIELERELSKFYGSLPSLSTKTFQAFTEINNSSDNSSNELDTTEEENKVEKAESSSDESSDSDDEVEEKKKVKNAHKKHGKKHQVKRK